MEKKDVSNVVGWKPNRLYWRAVFAYGKLLALIGGVPSLFLVVLSGPPKRELPV